MSHTDLLAGTSACLLVDSDKILKWQYAALTRAVERGLSISCVLVCDNNYRPKRHRKHAGYYAIRVTAMTNRWTSEVPWRSAVPPDTPVIHFDAVGKGAWQQVPEDVAGRLAEYRLDAVIKFGMGLLRDPDILPARHGVLSYHHGDPSQYRGRPAGFYEVLHSADHFGVMVQRLSNKLDAGAVLAFASCKLFPHSYHRSLENIYGNSVYLLTKALRNANAGRTVDLATTGKNYTLPDNKTVMRFLATTARRKLSRALYGTLREKHWRVAFTNSLDLPKATGTVRLRVDRELRAPGGYAFIADPAVAGDDAVLCEGMHRRTGVGHLLVLDGGGARRLDTGALPGGHLSYPHLVHDGGRSYLLPEMASVGPQLLATLNANHDIESVTPLLGVEDLRLVDPTLFHHDGLWWLFAGVPQSASDVLFLWTAAEINGPYVEHPDSPVVMDVSRARCAGPIHPVDGQLFRFGQDNRGSYGDGVNGSLVTHLTPERYEEQPHLEIRMEKGRGPHTITLQPHRCVVDVYGDVVNPLAWLLRLQGKIRAQRPR